ncbi:hypothetical protein [Silvibacterium sp.]|uniref:hypothetical protein n=1 Tax=Silvibacterium sp. TaxID=1964179 RepID=UPI0039E2EEF8
MANALDDVQETFTTLDAQYNTLLIGCKTQADRDALKAKYALAQQNYDACVNKLLSDDDATVAALDKQLKTANVQVKTAVAQMGNMQKVIGDITTAVSYGSQLLSMV